MDPSQILQKATYPLQTFFSFFIIFTFQIFMIFVFPFSLTWDLMGVKISKHYLFCSFGPISTKLCDKYVDHRRIQAITFLAICQKLKILGHFGIFVIPRYCSYSFHSMSAKLYEDICYYCGIQTITFQGNQPTFKNFAAL